MNNKILILTAVNPTRAYSCVKYLYDHLTINNDVELWAAVPKESFSDYNWGKKCFSFFDGVMGNIPKVRMIVMQIKGFFLCFKYRNKTIICHELYHYKSASLIKRWFPKTKFIHYCTEMYSDKNASFQQRQQKFYIKHANEPDLIIECNSERLNYRKEKYNLTKSQVVIENTIPKKELENIKRYKKDGEIPLIVFSGGCHTSDELDIEIDALEALKFEYNAIFYLYGNKECIQSVIDKINATGLKEKIRVITGLSREEVLPKVSMADIGLVYYDPEYSLNCEYAAPTKFFEYIGLGVPIVCSKNKSLIGLIDKYRLGEYLHTNDSNGMAEAINKLKDPLVRDNISKSELNAFNENICYEKQASNGLQALDNIINS